MPKMSLTMVLHSPHEMLVQRWSNGLQDVSWANIGFADKFYVGPTLFANVEVHCANIGPTYNIILQR